MPELNRIISAEPLPGYRLKVAFNDGLSGVFAVEPERRGGVFLKLLDTKIFNIVTVNPGFSCVDLQYWKRRHEKKHDTIDRPPSFARLIAAPAENNSEHAVNDYYLDSVRPGNDQYQVGEHKF